MTDMTEAVPGLFITGTDTGVGKTYVGALIARKLASTGLRVGVYKPVASGCLVRRGVLVSEDAVMLWEAAGRPGRLERVCPQRFLAPLAPHLAAQAEGKQIDQRLLRSGLEYWRKRSDVLLVEGAGGLLSPLGEDQYVADLACDFGFPLLVVAKNVLGAINQTLQTLVVAAAYDAGLPIAGIVLNNPTPPDDDLSRQSNFRELQARCRPPVLTEIAYRQEQLDCSVDWYALAKDADRGPEPPRHEYPPSQRRPVKSPRHKQTKKNSRQ